jgi:hypothetical protein
MAPPGREHVAGRFIMVRRTTKGPAGPVPAHPSKP